jgi:predicted RNase H-like nuclease
LCKRARTGTLPGVNAARFLGLDLAWSDRNPSGLAAIDARGRVLDAHANLRTDDEIVAWVRANLGTPSVLGIDMPTIVRNPSGTRPCERELRAVFGRYHAGPHPANLARFPDGGRARRMLERLAVDGVLERAEFPARAQGRIACEVFPHPAHVRLFSLPRIFRYKKKARAWDETLAEWSRYRAALAGLRRARPALVVPDWIPLAVGNRGYKAWEDILDALTCAYVASYLWYWGTAAPHARVFGDLAEGYIIVPNRAAAPL